MRVKKVSLGVVGIRQLSRDPGGVLARVARGERLLVRRHKKVVATIQPIAGSVVLPHVPRELSVDGSPLGDAQEEAAKLTRAEKLLLTDAVGVTRIIPVRVSRPSVRWQEVLELMEAKGLVRKSPIGWILRGRGMVLREVLLAEAGMLEEDTWRLPQVVAAARGIDPDAHLHRSFDAYLDATEAEEPRATEG